MVNWSCIVFKVNWPNERKLRFTQIAEFPENGDVFRIVCSTATTNVHGLPTHVFRLHQRMRMLRSAIWEIMAPGLMGHGSSACDKIQTAAISSWSRGMRPIIKRKCEKGSLIHSDEWPALCGQHTQSWRKKVFATRPLTINRIMSIQQLELTHRGLSARGWMLRYQFWRRREESRRTTCRVIWTSTVGGWSAEEWTGPVFSLFSDDSRELWRNLVDMNYEETL